MIFNEKYKILLKDIGKENLINNKGILEILENVATHHSDLAGYGPNNMEKTKLGWVLLDWKIQVLKRPKYGEILSVNTWGRSMKKSHTNRDFEIYDEQNNLCVIGTSKWVIVNIDTGKITKITDEIYEKYQLETKKVFEEDELDKIKIPEKFESEITYTVRRKDIDLNGHMHNLYYLDLAYEALPEEVYNNRPYNNFRIQYKREIKLGDKIKCQYSFEDGKHIVSILNEKDNKVNAIVILWN